MVIMEEDRISYIHRIQGWKGTSMIIWSNLCCQNPSLGKVVQHPVQLNLKIVQCWGIHPFSGDIEPVADCSHCEKLSFSVQLESPQKKFVPITPVFIRDSFQKGSPHLLGSHPLNTLTW